MQDRKQGIEKEGVFLSTRERILTIRLLEKLGKHPAYAQVLGITVKKEKLYPQAVTDSQSAGKLP